MGAKWFLALLVRGSHVEGELDEKRMGDMLYRLVRASDEEQAYTRAQELGAQLTETLTDDDGTEVSLEFLGLADLTEIGASELTDGTEIYSQLLTERPSEMVAKKEDLTVFESALESGDDDGAEEDRFENP